MVISAFFSCRTTKVRIPPDPILVPISFDVTNLTSMEFFQNKFIQSSDS